MFYAQTASTNLRFFLGKDNRRYSVRTYVGKEKEEEEEKEDAQTRVPQTYLRVQAYDYIIYTFTYTRTPANHARVRDTLYSCACVGN